MNDKTDSGDANGALVIAIHGRAGSGKDTFADMLQQFFLAAYLPVFKMALADPLKRVCKEVFDFTDEQLWGPSHKRNEPDVRYLRKGPDGEEYLTPRVALQLCGTEFGRACCPDIWCMNHQREVKRASDVNRNVTVLVPDVRFPNEVAHFRRTGALLVKIVRPLTDDQATSVGILEHESERGLADDLFDYVFMNDRSLDELQQHAFRVFDKDERVARHRAREARDSFIDGLSRTSLAKPRKPRRLRRGGAAVWTKRLRGTSLACSVGRLTLRGC